jgi:hypothetical protein
MTSPKPINSALDENHIDNEAVNEKLTDEEVENLARLIIFCFEERRK